MDQSPQSLIEQLKLSIDSVNECSKQLSQQQIFVYLKQKNRELGFGDQIELHDVILHKSLIKEGLDAK